MSDMEKVNDLTLESNVTVPDDSHTSNDADTTEKEFFNTEHVREFCLTDSYIEEVQDILNEAKVVPEFWRNKYYKERCRNWEIFYKQTTNRFWKDRSWLLREFAPLVPSYNLDLEKYGEKQASELKASEIKVEDYLIMLEIGCGTGSTIFPCIARNPRIKAYGYDISRLAISSLNDRWDSLRNGIEDTKDEVAKKCLGGWEGSIWNGGELIGGSVWDVTQDLDYVDEKLLNMRRLIAKSRDDTIEENDISSTVSNVADIVCLIFCLSAVPPHEQKMAAKRITDMLIPGGTICIRDYGKYDELELKFARSRTAKTCEKNCYVRGDQTLQYYWTLEELRAIFVDYCGLEEVECKYVLREFTNRKTRQILKRVWVQAQFKKIN